MLIGLGQIPLSALANNGQQYNITPNGHKSTKNRYGKAPTNPLATQFSNFPVNGTGLPLSRPNFGKVKAKIQQSQQQAQRPGPSGLLGPQNTNETPLIPVKSLHPMTTDQQLRTVFVSKIPELMDTNTLRAIIEVVPGLETFVRLLNGRSEPLSFGFARFASVDSVKVFMDTFSQINSSKLTNGTFDSLFTIFCEENTTRYLQDQIEERGEQYYKNFMRTTDRERVDNISRQIKTWYELTAATYGDDLNIKLQSTANEEDEANKDANSDIESDEENLDSIKIDESEFTDLEIDDKDTVLREIKEFRLLSIKFEKVKKDQEVEEKKERDKYLEKLTSNVLADGKATVRKHGEEEDRLFTERDFREMSDSEDDPLETDERLEELRQARIRQKEERGFEEDQRKWIARERMRTSALEREKLRDENLEERMERDKQKAIQQFAEFLDGGDYERKTMEYYFNHATWVKKRMTSRQREIMHDKQDAEEELLENAERDTDKAKFLSSLATEISGAKSSEDPSTGKFKLSLGGAKKQALAKEEDDGEEEERKQAIRTLLSSTDYGTISGIEDFKSLTNNNVSVVSMVDNIPESSEELFALPVAWEFLTEDIVEDRIKPFITALIMEYLGIQEDELIQFVETFIREHKPPQELVSELEMTLDEDAVIFTQRLWRLLIFETERQKGGL